MMISRTEQEIIRSWKGSIDIPLVSICTITYNQEKYIKEALNSLLMQETNFPFEVLINDDFSTDNTGNIIREYENKYPHIIKPIYQKENQAGKGINPDAAFNYLRAKGKYIALCEGDDYWIDKNKLQYQIEKMKEHDNCQISFHPAIIVDDQIVTERVLSRHLKYDKIFNVSTVIEKNGGFFPTASIIFEKVVINNMPEFFQHADAGDYFLQIFGSLNGGALYLEKVMSARRIHNQGVWTSIVDNFEARKELALNMTETIQKLDEFLDFKYHKEIMDFIGSNFLLILRNKKININDRIDLFGICKDYFSTKEHIAQQYFFIKEEEQLNGVQINNIRDSAIALEKENIKLAHNLMEIAHKARPNGSFIEEKLNEYKSIIKGNDCDSEKND